MVEWVPSESCVLHVIICVLLLRGIEEKLDFKNLVKMSEPEVKEVSMVSNHRKKNGLVES